MSSVNGWGNVYNGNENNPRCFQYIFQPGKDLVQFKAIVDRIGYAKSKTEDGWWEFDRNGLKIGFSDNFYEFPRLEDFLKYLNDNYYILFL